MNHRSRFVPPIAELTSEIGCYEEDDDRGRDYSFTAHLRYQKPSLQRPSLLSIWTFFSLCDTGAKTRTFLPLVSFRHVQIFIEVLDPLQKVSYTTAMLVSPCGVCSSNLRPQKPIQTAVTHTLSYTQKPHIHPPPSKPVLLSRPHSQFSGVWNGTYQGDVSHGNSSSRIQFDGDRRRRRQGNVIESDSPTVAHPVR